MCLKSLRDRKSEVPFSHTAPSYSRPLVGDQPVSDCKRAEPRARLVAATTADIDFFRFFFSGAVTGFELLPFNRRKAFTALVSANMLRLMCLESLRDHKSEILFSHTAPSFCRPLVGDQFVSDFKRAQPRARLVAATTADIDFFRFFFRRCHWL